MSSGPDKAGHGYRDGLHFDGLEPVGRGAFGKVAGETEEAFFLKGGSQSAVATIGQHHGFAGTFGHEAPGVALIMDGGGTGAGGAGAGGTIVFAGESNAIALFFTGGTGGVGERGNGRSDGRGDKNGFRGFRDNFPFLGLSSSAAGCGDRASLGKGAAHREFTAAWLAGE